MLDDDLLSEDTTFSNKLVSKLNNHFRINWESYAFPIIITLEGVGLFNLLGIYNNPRETNPIKNTVVGGLVGLAVGVTASYLRKSGI